MGTTSIEWVQGKDGSEGHTFNPWVGCAKVHAGCTNCYAEADFDKRRHFAQWGPHGTRVLTTDANWSKPLKWNREAEAAGVRQRVFCASLADVFEEWNGRILDHNGATMHRGAEWYSDRAFVGGPLIGKSVATLQDVRNRLFKLIDATPWLDWLLLTKRPENVRKMWPDQTHRIDPEPYRHNVWIGTSVSDQSTADAMIPELLKCRDLSPVLFLSMEPLLGPVDLKRVDMRIGQYGSTKWNVLSGGLTLESGASLKSLGMPTIDWIIIGGESGPNARPCRATWVSDIVSQCKSSGVPVFVKQLGSNAEEGYGCHRKLNLRDKKGGDPAEWPEYPRVRQFPEVSE